jgi:hypothetical protein
MAQHTRGDAGVPDGIMNSYSVYKKPTIVEDIKFRRLNGRAI